MPWRDRFTELASFRGVEFLVESADSLAGGHRGPTDQYPQRDEPFAQNLGRRANEFGFQGLVHGPDYDLARDELIEACNQGVGTLVHPYRGTHQVICRRCRVIESVSEAGMARFDLQFDEAGQNVFPSDVPDSFATLVSATLAANTVVQDAFDALFDLIQVPQWVVGKAEDLVLDLTSAFRRVFGQVVSGGDPADFFRDLAKIDERAVLLLAEPKALATEVAGAATALADLATSPARAVDAMIELFEWGDGLEPVGVGASASRARQAQNQEALVRLVRRAAATEAARRGSEVEFRSYDHAVTIRTAVTALLDLELEVAGGSGEDATFNALRDIYTRFVAVVNSRGANLALVTRVTPPETAPALVLAYQLYTDAERDVEIVERNRIRHPGFVPGGVEIEVLSA